MAVRYGTFRICILRTSHLEPYRTSVPYTSVQFLKRTVPVPLQKGVTYQRTVLLSKNWGVPYRTHIPYRNAILAFNYSQLSLTLKSLAYKSATLIHTFSVGFRSLLLCVQKAGEMCKNCWIFKSNNVPTYRTRIIAKKAYRTSVPYILANIEAYRTILPSLLVRLFSASANIYYGIKASNWYFRLYESTPPPNTNSMHFFH